MNKQKLRQGILEGMCYCTNNEEHLMIKRYGKYPTGFKPGISDRLIFNRILKGLMKNIYMEDKTTKIEPRAIALRVLTLYYWRDYGWFDDNEIREYQER